MYSPFDCEGCTIQVESIVLSIISMLSSPNDESPANVEAAVSILYIILSFPSQCEEITKISEIMNVKISLKLTNILV